MGEYRNTPPSAMFARLLSPRILGLVGPVLALIGWSVGSDVLLVAALTGWMVAVLLPTQAGAWAARSGGMGADRQAVFLVDLDAAIRRAQAEGGGTACIVLGFDNIQTVLDRHGRAAQAALVRLAGDRIAARLRDGDRMLPLDGGGYAIALAPARRLDLETVLQVTARLQSAASEPSPLGGVRLSLSCSAGFCLADRLPGQNAAALLDAAQVAADEARRQGPGALRAYAPGMARRRADRDARRAELEVALDEGQIVAWFQPQVSTETGAVTGFEALVRWQHPTLGFIAPGEFLPDLLQAGLSERLSEVMVHHALVALSRWDSAGFAVPCIGVNASGEELRNPRFADKLRWELDRFDLAPARLAIEVMETVIATADHDVVVRNVAALARLGCRIDLDDFGTGHSSIANIRRFAVHRLKIDRSFVMRADQDIEQQRLLSAVLSMAERLGLDTLAEGVETPGELSLLAQLGCGHVQGFCVGRPMPFEAATVWLEDRHNQSGPLAEPSSHRVDRGTRC